MRTILCLHGQGFHWQVFKFVGLIKKDKEEQKKNRGSVFVAESAYNSENTQKIRDQLNGSRNIQGFAFWNEQFCLRMSL